MTLKISELRGNDRVSLHELGHVIGLLHEHQRYDRDSYIIVPDTAIGLESWDKFFSDVTLKFNYAAFPEFIGGLVWKPYYIQFFGWTITLYYLAWDNNAIRVTKVVNNSETTFDYESIMLYSRFVIPNTKLGKKYGELDPNTGLYLTKRNKKLSSTDIATAKSIYQ